MSLQSVADLAERVAGDSAARAALRDNPADMRRPLQLSDAHVRALLSASSFSTARPVATTSSDDGSPSIAADSLLGTLLPPEGTGFASTGELPPSTLGTSPAASPHASPRTMPPRAGPISPATPRAPTQGTGPTVPQGGTPRAPGSGNGNTVITTGTSSTNGAGTGQQDAGAGVTLTSVGLGLTACRCACDAAMTALVAEVSATAQTTITGITAIASL